MFVIDIILFLIVLGVNIAVHEFAHFYFAKRADILCHEYAIGMGPAIYQKKKGETLYAIRAIPLGGYVSMAGEDLVDFVKVDNTIGIRLNDDGYVSHIVLDNSSEYDFIGKVKDFDLYGQDNAPLFLTLNVSGEVKEFPVLRDAMYVLSEKKEMQVAPAERSYENKTLWERFLVVIAGPVSNFLIALIILFFVGFFVQKPLNTVTLSKTSIDELREGDVVNKVNGNVVTSFDEIVSEIYSGNSSNITFNVNDNRDVTLKIGVSFQGLGFANIDKEGKLTDDLVIGQVFGRPKDLIANDEIKRIYIGDKIDKDSSIPYIDVNTWDDLINYANDNKEGNYVYIQVLRNGSAFKDISYRNINSQTIEKLGATYIGYSVGISRETKFDLGYSLVYPFRKTASDMRNMWNTIVLLFSPKSGVSAKDLAGPIGIFSLVKDAKSAGILSFFTFFAFLSINIGFLNLLPIPALDGGRLVFIAYEGITRKKVNKKVENTLITITFLLLLVLMVFVMFNDVIRLFN